MRTGRRASGTLAQSLGAAWESHFYLRAKLQGIGVIRIPDGCRQLAHGRIQRIKTPFDAVLVFDGISAFIDLKRNFAPRFAFSQINQAQLTSLGIASTGGISGYVCSLAGEIVFFSHAVLSQVRCRSSLGVEDGLYLGDEAGSFEVKKLFTRTQQPSPSC